jgi:hypothetical protein
LKRREGRVDELLAAGTLGGPEYDEILRRVLEKTAPATRRRWIRRVVGTTVVVIPALAVSLVVLLPRALAPTPKGALGASASIALSCSSSGAGVCRPGDTLMFSVNAAVASGFFGAYAERVGDPTHAKIWYFPTAAAEGPRVVSGVGTIVLQDGVRLGPEHRPGDYRVTVWLSERLLTRAELDTVPTAPTAVATLDLKVVP